jgi:hypothetical protein
MTDPSSRQRGCPTFTTPQLSDSNKNLVLGSTEALDQDMTGRLTVGRNVTLPLSGFKSWEIFLIFLEK